MIEGTVLEHDYDDMVERFAPICRRLALLCSGDRGNAGGDGRGPSDLREFSACDLIFVLA
jgi:hypothetical protein